MSEKLWDKIFSEGAEFSKLNVIFLERLLERIRTLRNGRAPENVIDLGAGTGDAVVKFAQAGFLVQAVDFSNVALEKAKTLAKQYAVLDKIVFTEMDLANLTLEKIAYRPADVIFCKLAFAFIENKKDFLDAVKTIMSDDGIFVLITPVRYPHLTYDTADKPQIAVDYEEVQGQLKENFPFTEIFHHDYHGDKQDVVTFLARKLPGETSPGGNKIGKS